VAQRRGFGGRVMIQAEVAHTADCHFHTDSHMLAAMHTAWQLTPIVGQLLEEAPLCCHSKLGLGSPVCHPMPTHLGK